MQKTRLTKALALCLASSTFISTSTAHADTFIVTANNDDGTGLVSNTLSWAILQANTNPGADEILLQTDVTVTGVMKRLIDSDTTLTSDSTRRAISGNDQFRPLFIKSGQVTIKDLNIENGLAKGGDSKVGGAGAGLGGGLFIYDGNVHIENVNLTNNQAQGGDMLNCSFSSCLGGGGMFGKSLTAGGGLFAEAQNGTGGYGGYHQYQSNDPLFGTGGNAAPASYQSGTSGGFGGGGGYGFYAAGSDGGFGGGGGSSNDYYYYLNPPNLQYKGGNGGFGAGGGLATYTNNDGLAGFGGQGELASGLGGAIFIRSGQIEISNSSITDSQAKQTTGGLYSSDGLGGGIFILHTLNNTNSNNQGMPPSLADVEICGLSFTNNHADTDTQMFNDNDDVFDLGNRMTDLCLVNPEITLFSGKLVIADGDNTPSTADFTDLGEVTVDAETVSWSYSIVNSGQGELNLTGSPIVEIQSPSGQFTVTQQPSNSTLNYQDVVTFEVTFNPTTLGNDTATISIANNDADENPYDFVIAAEGIAPQPKLLVTQNGQAIAAEDETPSTSDGTDFGYTPVSGGLIEQTFELHNVGFAPLELSNHTGSIHTVSHDNSMSISSQLTQFELQPNESLPFTVAFDPQQVGPANINYINITSNDPDFSNYYFQVTGYGQATMYLNALQTDIQEGEVLVFEVATDLPVYDHASFQFALTGAVDESDFTQSSSVLSGQAFLTAGYSSTIFHFSTATDGIYEGVEDLTFGILSDDPAINQSTPFLIAGSIDDDFIFGNGFESLTFLQLNTKLNLQAGEEVATCEFSGLNCYFLKQQFILPDFPANTQTQQYIEWLQYTIQSQQPLNDWDKDGHNNDQDVTPLGIMSEHETE